MNQKYKQEKGQSLVELLIVIGLCAVLLPVLITGLISSRSGKAQAKERVEALTLLKEAEESVRSIREKDWDNLAPIAADLHTERDGTGWKFADAAEVMGNFTRKVVLNNVFRDADGNILETGDTDQIDPSTKKATVTVSWSDPIPSSVESTIFLTRYIGNSSFIDTTEVDFKSGVNNSTQVKNISGGEVTLANNNHAKWCSPSLSTATIDLPDGPPVAVAAVANPTSHDIPNDVFVAVAPSNSTSEKLAYLTVTANNDTPVPTLKGTFTLDSTKYSSSSYFPTGINLDNNFKTNDVTYYRSPSNKLYALLATNLPSQEVVAVLIRDSSGNEVFQDPDHKIYKYQTFFNTRIYGTGSTIPPEFNNPSANTADTNTGDKNGFEVNPTNAYTNNGAFAVDNNSGTNSNTDCSNSGKDRHQFYEYNISIPSGNTINGIEISLIAKVDSTTGSPKMCVQLSWDGGSHWTAVKSTSNLTTNSATYTLGSGTDNWGRTWSSTDLNNSHFRVRITNVASNTSRDFSLDYIGVKVYSGGGTTSSNDQAPFGYGASSIDVLGDRGYVSSGGYLYIFDLSNIDSKTPTSGLDMIGCRIELDGYDCKPGSGIDRKYDSGETGTTWSDTTYPVHNDCTDGGNVEIYADNDVYPVQVGSNVYVFIAVGAGTNPELDVVNATSAPTSSSTPKISDASCGRISGGNSTWKVVGSLDFNSKSGTEEAANSVYANSDGTRAYISSNGGIDANHDGLPDSYQLYVVDTSNKASPKFLSGVPGSPSYGPTSGYYYGTGANAQLFPRRSLTVLNGQRAILVGKDGITDTNDAQEYQVVNLEDEKSPIYCGGIDFDQGFNDLTSVSEADGDNFVYMVANTTEKQLKIIEGGPDTGIYASTGTFVSKPYQFTSPVVFNRFVANVNQPSTGSTVEIQVSAAPANPITNNCSGVSYEFIGPDQSAPTTSTYKTSGVGISTIEGMIPHGSPVTGYQNPSRCFEYKAILNTLDNTKTPVLLDMSINYSP
jgi:type II secretory pathway pseudopilin PulG